MLMFYWSRNKQKTKTNDATIIAVSVYFSWALDPFSNLELFAFKQLQRCFTANICTLLNQTLEVAD